MSTSLKSMLQHIEPRSTGFEKVRVGEPHDGGYVVVNHGIADLQLLLSFGVGDTILFEKEFLGLAPRCQCHLFDHTIDKPEGLFKNMHFHQIGVSSLPYEKLQSISSIIDQVGSIGDLNTFLKMDIEGDEWGVLLDMDDYFLSRFAQMVVEFHHWKPLWGFYAKIYEKLARFFYVVHIHGNNHGPVLTENQVSVPMVIELTFLNRRLVPGAKANIEYYPTPLDAPNNPGRAELMLDYWPFLPRL